MYTDMLGNPVNVGDKVAYPTKKKNFVKMTIGTVLEVHDEPSRWTPEYEIVPKEKAYHLTVKLHHRNQIVRVNRVEKLIVITGVWPA